MLGKIENQNLQRALNKLYENVIYLANLFEEDSNGNEGNLASEIFQNLPSVIEDPLQRTVRYLAKLEENSKIPRRICQGVSFGTYYLFEEGPDRLEKSAARIGFDELISMGVDRLPLFVANPVYPSLIVSSTSDIVNRYFLSDHTEELNNLKTKRDAFEFEFKFNHNFIAAKKNSGYTVEDAIKIEHLSLLEATRISLKLIALPAKLYDKAQEYFVSIPRAIYDSFPNHEQDLITLKNEYEKAVKENDDFKIAQICNDDRFTLEAIRLGLGFFAHPSQYCHTAYTWIAEKLTPTQLTLSENLQISNVDQPLLENAEKNENLKNQNISGLANHFSISQNTEDSIESSNLKQDTVDFHSSFHSEIPLSCNTHTVRFDRSEIEKPKSILFDFNIIEKPNEYSADLSSSYNTSDGFSLNQVNHQSDAKISASLLKITGSGLVLAPTLSISIPLEISLSTLAIGGAIGLGIGLVGAGINYGVHKLIEHNKWRKLPEYKKAELLLLQGIEDLTTIDKTCWKKYLCDWDNFNWGKSSEKLRTLCCANIKKALHKVIATHPNEPDLESRCRAMEYSIDENNLSVQAEWQEGQFNKTIQSYRDNKTHC